MSLKCKICNGVVLISTGCTCRFEVERLQKKLSIIWNYLMDGHYPLFEKISKLLEDIK